MNGFRKERINIIKLSVIAVFAVAISIAVESSKKNQKDSQFEYKLAAANLMQKSLDVIKKARMERKIPINKENNPNETGMIGAEYTDITSSLGSLSAKRTSTNPNFAGVIIEMLFKAGVKMGDRVAISLSGSFPTLNIAVFSAAKVLKLQPAIISSVGTSMYGANDPQLTWLDMESILEKNGIFPYISEAASLGGIVETKGGVGRKGIKMGLEAISRNGVKYLNEQGEKTLIFDIERRLAIYDQTLGYQKPAVFINIGGSLTSLGNCREAYALSTGLLSKIPSSNHPQRGIIFRMSERRVPVIHLLDINKLAIRYGLPIDPIPLPPIPSGNVMKPKEYPLFVVLLGLIFLCLTIALINKRKLVKKC